MLDAKSRGLQSETEYGYNTTGGILNSRYADVVVLAFTFGKCLIWN